jgi:hypothetical protein
VQKALNKANKRMSKVVNNIKSVLDSQAGFDLQSLILLMIALSLNCCKPYQDIKEHPLMVIDSVRFINKSDQSEFSPYVEFKIKIINNTDQKMLLYTGQDYNLSFGDTTSFFTINNGSENDKRFRKKYFYSNKLDTAFNHIYLTKKTPADIAINPGRSAYLKLIKFYQTPTTKKDSLVLLRYVAQCKIAYNNKGNLGNLQHSYPDYLIIKSAITKQVKNKGK